MTNRKETRPKPSHPNKIATILGIKITNLIETTKRKTSQLKRGRKTSSDIYSQVNSITQAEIKRTTQPKLNLTQSKTNEKSTVTPLQKQSSQVKRTLTPSRKIIKNPHPSKKKHLKNKSLSLPLTK